MKLIKVAVFAVALSAVLSSCATTKALRQTTIAEFESSGSPCLDAVMINMSADGCTTIEQQNLNPEVVNMVGKRLHCSEYADNSDPSSGWLIHEFYALRPSPRLQIQPGLLPVCLDNNVIVLWSERD